MIEWFNNLPGIEQIILGLFLLIVILWWKK